MQQKEEGNTNLVNPNKSRTASEMFGQESNEDCVGDPVPFSRACNPHNPPAIIYRTVCSLNGL